MRVPTINELQDLWVYKRVNQYYDEHRPAPDHSLFIAELKEAVAKIKADAWDEAANTMRLYVRRNGLTEAYQLDTEDNPYRKQEEA